jgi:diadenylate cyclase
LRGTIKELAQLDGAFVVSAAGIVIAACRYLDAAASPIDLPLGLGSRHIAAAHISSATRAVGIVVSESAVVRLFCHGSLIGEIIPELWMMKRYDIQAGGRMLKETVGDLAVITPRRRQRN